jgi:hypothetical protein
MWVLKIKFIIQPNIINNSDTNSNKQIPIHVAFMVKKVVLENIFSQRFGFPLSTVHASDAPCSFICLSQTLYDISKLQRY